MFREKIDAKTASNPAWRSNLIIRITNSKVSPHANPNIYIHGSLKNGKLHGLVRIFGQMTVDPKGHCSNMIFPYIDPIFGLHRQVKFGDSIECVGIGSYLSTFYWFFICC